MDSYIIIFVVFFIIKSRPIWQNGLITQNVFPAGYTLKYIQLEIHFKWSSHVVKLNEIWLKKTTKNIIV